MATRSNSFPSSSHTQVCALPRFSTEPNLRLDNGRFTSNQAPCRQRGAGWGTLALLGRDACFWAVCGRCGVGINPRARAAYADCGRCRSRLRSRSSTTCRIAAWPDANAPNPTRPPNTVPPPPPIRRALAVLGRRGVCPWTEV
eukprot:2009296-Rhodomonas_salina.1